MPSNPETPTRTHGAEYFYPSRSDLERINSMHCARLTSTEPREEPRTIQAATVYGALLILVSQIQKETRPVNVPFHPDHGWNGSDGVGSASKPGTQHLILESTELPRRGMGVEKAVHNQPIWDLGPRLKNAPLERKSSYIRQASLGNQDRTVSQSPDGPSDHKPRLPTAKSNIQEFAVSPDMFAMPMNVTTSDTEDTAATAAGGRRHCHLEAICRGDPFGLEHPKNRWILDSRLDYDGLCGCSNTLCELTNV
ncbi:hypothetical protein H4582DRAFT_2057434 [Lactarius indigo]|nr:hypothetical protein H4582DRAFT_2057434 [Lactarius indigo]